MKLQVNELREGMVTSVGTVQEISQYVEDSRVTHYGVRFQDGWELDYPTDVAFRVTKVPAKHLKRNMEVTGFGMVNTETVIKEGLVRVGIRNYGVKVYSPDELVPLDPTPATVVLDPQKHLLWAIDNKDWAQARAALTELEKQA